MRTVEGNSPIADNDWDSVQRGGAPTIKRQIDSQMSGSSCVILLIGSQTAMRKWVLFAIATGWNAQNGVVGVYVHNLRESAQLCDHKGMNPFDCVTLSHRMLSTVVKAYDPPYESDQQVYAYIKDHLSGWAEESICTRVRN
jgi:hypothetical protein